MIAASPSTAVAHTFRTVYGDGPGDVETEKCGVEPLSKNARSFAWIEWEHIVPASLTPARQVSCWQERQRFDSCRKANGSYLTARDCCETVSRRARTILFDLHNLAPSIGQVNWYRTNDRYGEVEKNYESWLGCDARDQLGGQPDRNKLARFEPPDCVKGDVARVWFYMHDKYNVHINDAERHMFSNWSAKDPVTLLEQQRDRRIAAIQGDSNPYVWPTPRRQ